MKLPSVPLSRGTLLALALILLLSSFAAIPMLQPFLFASDDVHHLYRLWELDQLVGQGIPYSRWAPDLFFGYGSPVFHYNSPLPYYPGVLFHRLGADYIDSFKLLYWLGLPLSGCTTYLWARQHLAPAASLFASLLYMYAPYHLLEIYLRGALPEYLAFVWFPLILWAARGLVVRGQLAYAALLGLSYAGLILTHNLSAYLFLPALLLYCAVLWPERRLPAPGALASLAGGLALAAGLSAFYALPALVEKDLVLFERLIGHLPDHLFPWQTLVASSPIHDYASTAPPEELRGVRLGLVQFILLLAGAVALLGRGTPPPLRRAGVWALLLTGGGLLLMQPGALWLWESVPLAGLVQFPWRLLAPLALSGALLGGLGAQRLLGRLAPAWRGVAYLSLAALVILSSLLGLRTARTTLAEEQVSRLGLWEFELGYGLAGASSGREYVPTWVSAEPVPPSADPVALLAEEPPSHYRAVPSDTRVVLHERLGNLFRYLVRAREPARLTLNHFYFPGWVATVDGEATRVEPSTPEGLVSMSLPAGEHLLELRFAETPLRAAADLISAAALGVALFLWTGASFRAARRLGPGFRRGDGGEFLLAPEAARSGLSLARAARRSLRPVGELAAGLALLWTLGWLFASSGFLSGDASAPAEFLVEIDRRLRIQAIDLSGPDLEREPLLRIASGTLLRATLVLEALPGASFASDESLFLCLVDRSYGRSDVHACTERELAGLPATRTLALLELEVPRRLPVGPYRLETGIYAAGASARRPFTAQTVTPLLRTEPGRLARPLFVRRPTTGPAANLAPEGLAFADSTSLLPTQFPPTSVLHRRLMEELPEAAALGSRPTRAGDPLAFDLLWRPAVSPATDYAVTARLQDPAGDVYAQATGIPLVEGERKGDVVWQRVTLPVPHEAPPGDYVLEAALSWRGSVVRPTIPPDASTTAGWAPLGQIRVHPAEQVPGRAPAGDRQLWVADGLRIFDYRLPFEALRPGSRLDLDVLWQAGAVPSEDIVVRFELQDDLASLLGEVTSPLGGTAYPSSRWRPGEVIRGQYHLPIAPSARGGPATLWASSVLAGGERPLARLRLGTVELRERPRRFEVPAIARPVGIPVPELGTLLGYNVEGLADATRPSHWSPGAHPAVTLLWQAAGPAPAEYKVSLQLVNEAGAVGVQHDSMPDGGEAPTTSWSLGEIVTDRHPLLLPAGMAAGRYRLLVIVYHEASGQRLAFAGVGDALQLDEISIP